jgi:large conductance mechanosensitive channel
MSVLSEFKDFVSKGNVIDMAVGIVIGLAFNAVVTAVVAGLITPLISVPGHVDFSRWAFPVGHGYFTVGLVLNAVISFLIVAAVLFFGVVRPLQKYKERTRPKPTPPTPMRACPECLSEVPAAAKRCRYCTSSLS